MAVWLVRQEKKNSLPSCIQKKRVCPFIMSCHFSKCLEFGGTDSRGLKSAQASVLRFKGNRSLDDYNTKLVAATSDGVNVNLGVYNGSLTMLKAERPWLVLKQCVNYRLELAIKDAVKGIA